MKRFLSLVIQKNSTLVRWLCLMVLLIAALTIPYLLFGSTIESAVKQAYEAEIETQALAALAFLALLLDVFLPIPSSFINTIAGAALGVVAGTIVCWAGMTIGCVIGYWVGLTAGTAVIKKFFSSADIDHVSVIGKKFGLGTLIITRAVPVIAESSTIVAGAVRFSFYRFLFAVSLANLGIAVIYSSFGALAYSTGSFLLAFAGAIGVPVAAILLRRLFFPGGNAG